METLVSEENNLTGKSLVCCTTSGVCVVNASHCATSWIADSAITEIREEETERQVAGLLNYIRFEE